MIDPSDLNRCRELHARARRGWLTWAEQPEYAALSAKLFAALTEREARLSVRTCRRRSVRMRRAMQVELAWVNGETSGLTRDVGLGGICATVSRKPVADGPVVVRLRLPGSAPLVAPGRVVRLVERRGTVSVSIALEELAPADAARLRSALLDDALSLASLHAPDVVTSGPPAAVRLQAG